MPQFSPWVLREWGIDYSRGKRNLLRNPLGYELASGVNPTSNPPKNSEAHYSPVSNVHIRELG